MVAGYGELKEARESDHELLKVHRKVPTKKAEGVTRLIYDNLNGLNNRLSNNEKLDKAQQVIDDLGADIVSYNEHHLNFKHKDNVNGLAQFFKVERLISESEQSEATMYTRRLNDSRKEEQLCWHLDMLWRTERCKRVGS